MRSHYKQSHERRAWLDALLASLIGAVLALVLVMWWST